jgi:hypothetical protein
MTRVTLAVSLAAVVAAAIALPATASANSVDATCNGISSCSPSPWFNTDVNVVWLFSPTAPDSTVPDPCVTSVTAEGETPLNCTATWNGSPPDTPPETKDDPITVRIDKTPPTGVAGASDRPSDRNGWYNHPFSVVFSASGDNLSGVAGCTTVPYSGPDGIGLSVAGSCSDVAGNVADAQSSTFNYDATSPDVTGALADRPPDHGDWYNHRVTFTFQGTDATSGIAGCTSSSYSGPVDSTAGVNGACTDNAGNVGLGNQRFKYDDARPAPADVLATPGNHRVEVIWKLPSGASSVSVTRTEQGNSAAPVVVYSGTRTSVVDKGLKNGHKYRYTVTDMDDAGNTNVKAIRAIPTASSLRPFVGTPVSSPPLLTWKKIKGATYYNVQLFFGRKKVLSTWPRTPSLQVKGRWHFRGKTYTLVPGHYRWYVWPGFGPLSQHNYGNRIGRSSFRMTG